MTASEFARLKFVTIKEGDSFAMAEVLSTFRYPHDDFVVLLGAGSSTSSGIPVQRSPLLSVLVFLLTHIRIFVGH
jgi:hypothetical protein